MFLLVGGGSRAFQVTCRTGTSRTNSALRMAFWDDWQKGFAKAFSTTSGAASSSNGNMTSKYYTIAISGSNGLVGTALKDELSKRATVNGKPVRIVNLQRGTDTASAANMVDTTEITVTWNPHATTANETLHPTVAAELDAIVHLAGENVATGKGPLGFLGLRAWTAAKKEAILNSRTIPTAALARVVAETPKPQTFLSASGVGAYGDNFIGNTREAVDESADISSSGGFLAEVSRQWEAAAAVAAETGENRVVNMRFGVVLSKQGGALAKLYPVFFLGGGGNVGAGDQYFSFISARDHARAIVHTLETPSLEGPVNFVAPEPCTNAQFTKAMGKGMSRPTFLPFPGFAVKLLFGQMGQEMLLGGVRAIPGKLEKSGFKFQHPTIDLAVQSALDENI